MAIGVSIFFLFVVSCREQKKSVSENQVALENYDAASYGELKRISDFLGESAGIVVALKNNSDEFVIGSSAGDIRSVEFLSSTIKRRNFSLFKRDEIEGVVGIGKSLEFNENMSDKSTVFYLPVVNGKCDLELLGWKQKISPEKLVEAVKRQGEGVRGQ